MALWRCTDGSWCAHATSGGMCSDLALTPILQAPLCHPRPQPSGRTGSYRRSACATTLHSINSKSGRDKQNQESESWTTNWNEPQTKWQIVAITIWQSLLGHLYTLFAQCQNDDRAISYSSHNIHDKSRCSASSFEVAMEPSENVCFNLSKLPIVATPTNKHIVLHPNASLSGKIYNPPGQLRI